MHRTIAGLVVVLALTACGRHVVNGVDHANPEAVFAAYSDATDKGDVEAIRRVVRVSQRASVEFATGTGGPTTYTIVRRDQPSADEIHLWVQFSAGGLDQPMPHVLVREAGKWYVDIEQTTRMLVESMGQG